MKIDECKEYYDDGKLRSHCFLYQKDVGDGIQEERRSGEFMTFYEEGQIESHSFYNYGNAHGEYVAYSETGIIVAQGFFHNEESVIGFPFLPEKPPRLPHKSNRNRYQTLEL